MHEEGHAILLLGWQHLGDKYIKTVLSDDLSVITHNSAIRWAHCLGDNAVEIDLTPLWAEVRFRVTNRPEEGNPMRPSDDATAAIRRQLAAAPGLEELVLMAAHINDWPAWDHYLNRDHTRIPSVIAQTRARRQILERLKSEFGISCQDASG